MNLVIIESPFAGETNFECAQNVLYARACLRDSLLRGEAPFASHLLYTQVLDDDLPIERSLGIQAGLAWGLKADFTIVYNDQGISPGMQLGIDAAVAAGRGIITRSLGGQWAKGRWASKVQG